MNALFHNARMLAMLPHSQDGASEKDFAAMVAFADDLCRAAGETLPFEPRLPYVSRRDEPAPGLTQAQALQNAKALSGPMIAVPAPFGQGE